MNVYMLITVHNKRKSRYLGGLKVNSLRVRVEYAQFYTIKL